MAKEEDVRRSITAALWRAGHSLYRGRGVSLYPWIGFVLLLGFLVPLTCWAQIDPVKRQLLQFGYNQPIQGHGPLAGYAFYYLNQPQFMRPDLTLRLAVAPTYLDSELGVSHAVGPQTDLGLGLAGGGFADSYAEVRQGRFLQSESFDGHGGKLSVSLYHRFNPAQRIPLNGVLRGRLEYTAYSRTGDTADNFGLPPNHATFHLHTGLRWGGREPVLRPPVAMELSAWYDGEYRTVHGAYGFHGDRTLEADSHYFWGEAMLAYTIPRVEHYVSLGVTAGTSLHPDRLSAYRLGGTLPLHPEFRFELPGYYYQELTARKFVLLSGLYAVPVDRAKRWRVHVFGSVADVDYLPGLQQPGHFHAGVGAGIGYTSPKQVWKIFLSFAHGFNAIRHDERGAQNVALLVQYDFEARQHQAYPSVEPVLEPERSRGLERGLEQLFGR
jgi:hypothetical protein